MLFNNCLVPSQLLNALLGTKYNTLPLPRVCVPNTVSSKITGGFLYSYQTARHPITQIIGLTDYPLILKLRLFPRTVSRRFASFSYPPPSEGTPYYPSG